MSVFVNPNDPKDLATWFAILVGFYGFLRKASLVPRSATKPGDNCLLISDLSVSDDHKLIRVTVRHTKTLQFRNRVLSIPMLAVPDSVLCPVRAWAAWCKFAPSDAELPLFSFVRSRVRGEFSCVTHSSLVARLRELISLTGHDSSLYSGHSLRRGGAEFCASTGLSNIVIQLRGDWKSHA